MSMTSGLKALLLPEEVQRAYEEASSELHAKEVIQRIWQRDHTVWRPEPTEISNRLGWLDLPSETLNQLPEIEERVTRLLSKKTTDVVLLGMGGSSLCPEVFRRTIGSREGFPRLHVLDSTVPDWVRTVTQAIQLESTLFILASKSGGTIEVMSAFKHFWSAVEKISSHPGTQFLAITDPGTGLESLARERGFAEIFLNRPDIGGRYSALSLFGMAPALLLGVDVGSMLREAKDVAGACRETDTQMNPGAQLGVFMAACAEAGRDKLTMIIDPAYESLGRWVEQLIAESTGKEGKGILPVAGEPLGSVNEYGSDRAFVVIAPEGDSSLSKRVDPLREAGHPVALFNLKSGLDLGAEFFRWEFATAVVSHFLDIQPFDQPNVQEAKTLTGQVLAAYQEKGSLPSETEADSLSGLLADVQPGDYFAIMAYLVETPEVESALSDVRRAVMKSHGIATTSGYGPRFLHSTGQYHKGGPNTGRFLQLIQDQVDLPVPGEPYGFSVLCAAQALGDYRALTGKNRCAVRIRLGKNVAEGIRALLKS